MTPGLRPNIFPALIYRDADRAAEFLKAAFGATEKELYRDEAGVVHHAELRLGAGLVMLGQYVEERWKGTEPPRPGASPTGLYVVIDDPDAHCARARDAGAEIIRGPEDMEYGSREYGALDCEGNRWSFGTYDPYAE